MFRTYQNALWQTQILPKGTDKKSGGKRKGHPPTKLTEQQVLECRARSEFFGWSLSHCAEHYKTQIQYMRNLLDYQVRSMLIPKPADAGLNQ